MSQHRHDRKDLGKNISVHNGSPLKKKKIYTQRYSKNPRYGDQVYQDSVKIFPGRKMALTTGEKKCQQGYKGNQDKKAQ